MSFYCFTLYTPTWCVPIVGWTGTYCPYCIGDTTNLDFDFLIILRIKKKYLQLLTLQPPSFFPIIHSLSLRDNIVSPSIQSPSPPLILYRQLPSLFTFAPGVSLQPSSLSPSLTGLCSFLFSSHSFSLFIRPLFRWSLP